MHRPADDALPEAAAAGAAPSTDPVRFDASGVPLVLPEEARQRAITLAAEALGAMAAGDVPLPLRRVAKFAPARRARLGAGPIAAALEADVGLRQRAGELAATRWPELARLVREGGSVVAADPVELATVAYLLRPPGWRPLVLQAAAQLAEQAAQRSADDRWHQLDRLREQLEALRASSREQLQAARAELEQLQAANTKLRHRLGAAREATRAAERQAEQATAAAAAAEAAATAAVSAADAEGRRLRGRLAEAEASAESTRRVAREGRSAESIRLRLLLDTLHDASQGLRRELALPPITSRPADLVGGIEPGVVGVDDVSNRGRSTDDPRLLAHLLELPQVHLIVDGYNVTKTGYGELPLEAQRTRLLGALGALAARTARTAPEVTVVFDGAALDGAVRVASPRGVRVRFSAPGVIADDVIRELVRAEPVGRPIVVVSSDREVADAVARSGARPVGAAALLGLLDTR